MIIKKTHGAIFAGFQGQKFAQFVNNGTGKNFYQLLGVSRDSSAYEIQRAFYINAMKLHPDKKLTSDTASDQNFQILKQAYQVLQNNELRTQYNQFLDLNLHQTIFQTSSFMKERSNSETQQNNSSYQYQPDYDDYYYYRHYSKNKEEKESTFKTKEKQRRNSSQQFYNTQYQYNKIRTQTSNNSFFRLQVHYFLFFGSLIFLIDDFEFLDIFGYQGRYREQYKESQFKKDALLAAQDAEIRRNNVILSKENLDDAPGVVYQRKLKAEEYYREKQIRIEVVPNQVDESQIQNSAKEQQNRHIMQEFDTGLIVTQSGQAEAKKPFSITLEDLEQEYM